jgi:hypothetical protein
MILIFIVQEAGRLGGQKAWRLRIIHPIKLPSFPASQPPSISASKLTFLLKIL